MLRWLPFVLVSACIQSSISELPLNPAPRPLARRTADQVEVYSAGRPERPFVDHVYLEGAAGADGPMAVVARLRERAGALGCDAIVLGSPRDQIVGQGKWVSGEPTYGASCIVYR